MKKIMAVIAAAAVALTLVGCDVLGGAKAGGTKYAKTFKLDASGEIKDADGKDAAYSRGFAAVSTSKKCSAIETTISLPMDKSQNVVLSADSKKAVVGLAFDVHLTKNAAGQDVYDFVLVGVKPSDGGFYIEQYSNVSKANLKESMNTNMGNIDENATVKNCDGKTGGAWASGSVKTCDAATVTTEGYSWKIKVTQAVAGTYEVYINDVKKGTYKRALTDEEKTANKGAYGQIFMYGNAPKGTKINAKFTSNKNATVGLFADEDEF